MGQTLNLAHECMAWLHLVPLFELTLNHGGGWSSKVVETPRQRGA
jgi:hypothetical protein